MSQMLRETNVVAKRSVPLPIDVGPPASKSFTPNGATSSSTTPASPESNGS